MTTKERLLDHSTTGVQRTQVHGNECQPGLFTALRTEYANGPNLESCSGSSICKAVTKVRFADAYALLLTADLRDPAIRIAG